MARLAARLASNAPGDYYVDDSCIDCAMCRVLAPRVFGRDEGVGLSVVEKQPGHIVFRTTRPLPAGNGLTVAAAWPKGIDIYFENVGGTVFDAVLPLLNLFARIPVCGLIAHYNATELPPGPDRVPAFMMSILVRRLTVRGFIVSDFAALGGSFH